MVEDLREETPSSSRPPGSTTSSTPSSWSPTSTTSTLRMPGLVTPPDVVPCEIYDLADDVMIKTSNGHGLLGGVER
jgi:hypothetical protein